MHREELHRLGTAEIAALYEAWFRRERRLDFRAAQICMLIANANRDREAKPTPFAQGDFFPLLRDMMPQAPDAVELESKIDAAMAGLGG